MSDNVKTVEEFEQHVADETEGTVTCLWVTLSEFGQMLKRLAKEKGEPITVTTQQGKD